MEEEIFDLVLRAQQGDKEAMSKILLTITPLIRNAQNKVKYDNRDDLKQNIVELLIQKIMSYDLKHIPNFSSFCQMLIEVDDEKLQAVAESTEAYNWFKTQ
ncbi:helix-turn-helix domain-containing protein [Paenibacillus sp. GCM10023252]|uniref:helix-turn-helix domain-containing protein n=1 Tax=Paenibacillus sp. GCM10023252 TaxID=3252649 RepID=UPI003616252B